MTSLHVKADTQVCSSIVTGKNRPLDDFAKSLWGSIFVIPACLRGAASAKAGESRNPGFPVKTGIQFLKWFLAFAGACLDSGFHRSDGLGSFSKGIIS
jgi:hypothetical protein